MYICFNSILCWSAESNKFSRLFASFFLYAYFVKFHLRTRCDKNDCKIALKSFFLYVKQLQWAIRLYIIHSVYIISMSKVGRTYAKQWVKKNETTKVFMQTKCVVVVCLIYIPKHFISSRQKCVSLRLQKL